MYNSVCRLVLSADVSQNPICTVTLTRESAIGVTVTKSNQSQNPIVIKLNKHFTSVVVDEHEESGGDHHDYKYEGHV